MEESQEWRQICFVQLCLRRKRSDTTLSVRQLQVPQILNLVHNHRIFKYDLNKLGFLSGTESVQFLAIHHFEIGNGVFVKLADGGFDFANHRVHFAEVPVIADFYVKEWLKVIHDDGTGLALFINSVHLHKEFLFIAMFLFLFFVVAG